MATPPAGAGVGSLGTPPGAQTPVTAGVRTPPGDAPGGQQQTEETFRFPYEMRENSSFARTGPVYTGPYTNEKFSHKFHSEHCKEYTTKDWKRDLTYFMKEVASTPNWSWRTRLRASRESVHGNARKFLEELPKDLWESGVNRLDFNDGKGPRVVEPWEILVQVICKNYGPHEMEEDIKRIEEFESIRWESGQSIPDFLLNFESKRQKAAELNYQMNFKMLSRKLLDCLHIRAETQTFQDILSHCKSWYPETAQEYDTMVNKIRSIYLRQKVGAAMQKKSSSQTSQPSHPRHRKHTNGKDWNVGFC